jgi:Fe-S cluster assembly iron-binding protein IscA
MELTDQAKEQLAIAINSFENEAKGIRIFESEGCCGPSFQMDFATDIKENEIAIEVKDISFFIAKNIATEMDAVTIDFNGQGFQLKGLKQKEGSGSCGCN